MNFKILRKTALGILVFIIVFLAVAWLAFVPFAKEADYRFVATWGEKGQAPGQFNDPTGIAISEGQVFVADARNDRIQVFDLKGGFLRSFGEPGKGPGKLTRPMNLTIFNQELYVPEYFNDHIQVFGLDGVSKRIIGRAGKGPGAFNAPGGVGVGKDGSLYVADFYNHRIQHLKADGTFIRQWGATGKSGIGAGEFGYPTDVALGADGSLYVADGYNDRVQAFNPKGKFFHKWGGPFAMNIYGPFNGWFATVTGIATDKAGNVFVADFYNHRVQKFSADGTFLTSFGSKGNGPGQFFHPIAIEITEDGTVFVVDYGNNRIQKWRQGK
jgi:DNA-binding beta-propeller fold protein YncE